MDLDLLFVCGIVIAVLVIPATLSALLDGRVPRTPAVLIIMSVLMVGYAINQRPSSYGWDTIPDTFVRVVTRYLN